MLPAPGQAVLVLETRAGDADTSLVESLNHAETEACATAERIFLRAFGGGCSVPVAALATVDQGQMTLTGLVAAPDGSKMLRQAVTGDSTDGGSMARGLAKALGEQGANELFVRSDTMAGGAEH